MSDRGRPVPPSRLGRLATFGQIAGGIATGLVGEGLRRLAQGERPHLRDLLLTPSNAVKVTEQLARLRGAAMKLGQMISLDAGDLLPAELTIILARLRETAHVMPLNQLQATLVQAWGTDWRRHFAHFDMTPIAAASIGQVHRATLLSGQELAVKVQYPGIARSIDSDIDNVATLLRMSGLLPAGLSITAHLQAAKQQLHEEADYLREAGQMRRYKALLAGDDRFVLPEPFEELLRPTILPMDFLQGAPIDALAREPEARRNEAMGALLDLTMHELFVFRLMQTDPNFANYRWQRDTGRIVLLDFGAARPVSDETARTYQALLRAGLANDRRMVRQALLAMNFLSSAQIARHGTSIDSMIDILLGHLHASPDGLFDFSDRGPVAALQDKVAAIIADRDSLLLPTPDKIFIQRKIGGMALLCTKMGARLPFLDLMARHG